jgi:4'-phosphopantetheinyl transferase
LAAYTGSFPTALRFEYSKTGRPELVGRPVLFNISHSSERMLVAVSAHHRLGVDIEHIRPIVQMLSMARSYFAAEEVEVLLALPEEQQLKAFYRCWTRKEAYLKARGEGFSISLDSFAVSLTPGESPRLVRAEDCQRWQFWQFALGEDYTACLTAESQPPATPVWVWDQKIAQDR